MAAREWHLVGVDHEPNSAPSIGAYLARQRELRKISLDELEQITQIPRRSLERLESGAFDSNPDGFARGFVRTVAVALGLDPADTVARMLSEPEGPLRSPGLEPPDASRWLRRAVTLAALVGILWILFGEHAEYAGEVVFRRDAVQELAREHRAESDVPAETAVAP